MEDFKNFLNFNIFQNISILNLLISTVVVIIIYYILNTYFFKPVKTNTPLTEPYVDITPYETPSQKAIINPTYLDQTARAINPNDLQYTSEVIDKQSEEIKKLRKKVIKLTETIEEGIQPTEIFYRKKLSNQYYPVVPIMNEISNDNYLNIYDDDFSNKTLSTTQFLSQTRPSKFYGSDVHFTSDLCDNYCETQDKNALLNPEIDLVRPLDQNNIQKILRK